MLFGTEGLFPPESTTATLVPSQVIANPAGGTDSLHTPHCLGLDRKHGAKGGFSTPSSRVGVLGGQLVGVTALPGMAYASCCMQPKVLKCPDFSWGPPCKGTFLVLLEWSRCLEGYEKPTDMTRSTNQAGCSKLNDTRAALALTPKEQTQSCPRKGFPRSHQPTLAPAVGGHRVEEQPAPKQTRCLPPRAREARLPQD